MRPRDRRYGPFYLAPGDYQLPSLGRSVCGTTWKVLVEGHVTGHLTASGTSHTRIDSVFSSLSLLPYARSSQFKTTQLKNTCSIKSTTSSAVAECALVKGCSLIIPPRYLRSLGCLRTNPCGPSRTLTFLCSAITWPNREMWSWGYWYEI